MKTFFLSLAGAFAALLLFSLAGLIFLIGVISAASTPEKQPSKLVLTLDLRAGVPDQTPAGGVASFLGQTGFIDILSKLDAAETDPAVKGVFIRGSEGALGSSRAEELRTAIRELRDAGKFVIAHSQGTYSTGPSSVRALTAADEIWMQPGTDLFASGVTFETLFMRGLLDRLSVTSEIEAFHEYKNAPNQFRETGYTEPHREAMTALAASVWQISLADIAEDRGLTPNAVRQALEAGPRSAQEALDLKLIDKLGWPEEALEAAKARGDDASTLSVTQYTPPSVRGSAPAIAIVSGEGAIVTGSGDGGPFNTDPIFASDAIAKSILAAGKNDAVKAIVFRVDSPGGSPTASDQIWRAIERVQEMGKPVVISMGSLAASGGYYVSTGADYILANRSTITGSIGIFGGKYAIADGLQQIGINAEAVTVGGEFAHAYGADAFTEDQRQDIRAWLQRGYDRFTSLVAEGREMPLDDVLKIAKGRVWSGADALDRGLVDEIGGFTAAITKARELAGIDADTKSRLIYYPARKTGFEALGDVFGASADVARAAAILGAVAGDERLNALVQQGRALQSGQAQILAPTIIER